MLEDSLTAIGFPICFYYGFTGVACGWYYRHDLMESARNFLLLGLGPLIGGLMLFGIGIKAVIYYGHAENVSSAPIGPLTLPLWMGIGGMVLGVDDHDRLTALLQRVLLTQNRNRAAAGCSTSRRRPGPCQGAWSSELFTKLPWGRGEPGARSSRTRDRAPLPY